MVGTVECLAGCLGLVAVFDALLESSPSSTGAGAPRRAGVFCSVSPAAGKGAAGSSFTCAEHAGPSRRSITSEALAIFKTTEVRWRCRAEGAG